MGSVGNTIGSSMYFVVFFLLYCSVAVDIEKIKKSSYVLLFLLFAMNIASLAYIASKKSHKRDNLRYRAIDLMSKTDDFLLYNRTDIVDLFTKIPMDIKMNRKELIIQSYSFGGPSWDRSIVNAQYHLMVKDSVLRIKEISGSAKEVSVMIGFTNPLPFLLRSAMPPQSYHWIHLGRTFSRQKNIHKLYDSFMGADFIYMPLISLDKSDHSYLNCLFYGWNFTNGRFRLYSINRYGLLFVDGAKMEEYGLKPSPLDEDREDITRGCSLALND